LAVIGVLHQGSWITQPVFAHSPRPR
jgi:hypothetical protein